jgi:hypothetical protein
VIWLWVALWVLLIVGATAVLGLIVRDVYRKGKALARVAAEEAERLSRAMAPLQDAADELEERREELAVFADPTELRRDRAKAAKRKESGKAGHRAAGKADRRTGRPERRGNGRHRSDPGSVSRSGATSQGTAGPRRERTT